MIDLVLLGCGGNMPMPNRFLSSLFINYKGRKILIDCGEGTQVSMRMKNCGFKNIDLICNDKQLQTIIREYPKNKIGIKQGIFLGLIQLKMSKILYLSSVIGIL